MHIRNTTRKSLAVRLRRIIAFFWSTKFSNSLVRFGWDEIGLFSFARVDSFTVSGDFGATDHAAGSRFGVVCSQMISPQHAFFHLLIEHEITRQCAVNANTSTY